MVILANNHPLGRIGITWQLSEYHGWGVFGLNIAKALINNGYPPPKLLHPPKFNINNYPELKPIVDEWEKNSALYTSNQKITHNDLTVIHSLGNNFALTNPNHLGKKNIGFIFFESTQFTPDGLERARSFDMVVAGSRWNAELLKKLGIGNVGYVMQGVDPSRFSALPTKTDSRFTIFSGGKLEFRKGQDIVLAAYKEFYKKYPNSLLITNWNNPWPAITRDLINSPHGFGSPNIKENQVDIQEWSSRTLLTPEAFKHHSFIPNAQMPMLYAQADIALFPNRAEGGTNLVAMECMAAGIPCILSANTGHMDLIGPSTCIPLIKQSRINNPTCQDWGESSIQEIFEKLEYAYNNQAEIKKIGERGRQFINQFSWSEQAILLINMIANTY